MTYESFTREGSAGESAKEQGKAICIFVCVGRDNAIALKKDFKAVTPEV